MNDIRRDEDREDRRRIYERLGLLELEQARMAATLNNEAGARVACMADRAHDLDELAERVDKHQAVLHGVNGDNGLALDMKLLQEAALRREKSDRLLRQAVLGLIVAVGAQVAIQWLGL